MLWTGSHLQSFFCVLGAFISTAVGWIPRMAFRLVLPFELRLLCSSAHGDLLNINLKRISSNWESARINVSQRNNVSLLFMMLLVFSGLFLFLFGRHLGGKFGHLFDFFGNAKFKVHMLWAFWSGVDHFLLNWLPFYLL